MSEEIHFLRAKTLSKKTTRSCSNETVIKRVMGHNLREIQSEFGERADSKIDPQRIHLNEILHGLGTADDVAGAAHDLMQRLGVTPRANAALGIEIVFGLPTGLTFDYRAYFMDAIKWANEYFAVPMLSAIIHNDEDYPHMHIVMLPAVDGKLDGRNLLGGKSETNAMHKDFHVKVSKRYGLKLPAPVKRHSAEVRHIATQMIRECLREFSGFNDATVDGFVKLLGKDIEAAIKLFGMTMPKDPNDTFVGIFTRDCGHDASAIALRGGHRKSAIALRDDDEPGRDWDEKQKRYALIALSDSPPLFPPPNEAQLAGIEATFTGLHTSINIVTERTHSDQAVPQVAILNLTTNDAIDDASIASTDSPKRSTPTPAAIDPRQCDLFDQPIIASSDSDPTTAGQREYRAKVGAALDLLHDQKRCYLSDREISRQTGISPPTVGTMRAKIMPIDKHVRMVQRGGKMIVMNVSNIGKRPAAPIEARTV